MTRLHGFSFTIGAALLWSAASCAVEEPPPVPEPPPLTEAPSEPTAFSPDYEIERLGSHLEPNALGLQTLGKDSARFTIRYSRAWEQSPKAVILIPPVSRLVTDLPMYSALADDFNHNQWSVVAVQLPLLPPGSDIEDYRALDDIARERIEATVSWMRQSGYETFVLFGYKQGAAIAHQFLQGANGEAGVVALATLGRWQHSGDLINQPALQLVGGLDDDGFRIAEQRHYQWLAQKSTPRLMHVEGAKQQFDGHAGQVSRYLRGWVQHLALR